MGSLAKHSQKTKIKKKKYDAYVNLQHILKVVIFSIFVNLQMCCKFTYESYIVFFFILFFVNVLQEIPYGILTQAGP